jgi:exonuclease SbcC
MLAHEIDLMSDTQREAAELDLADQKLTFSELKQENTSFLQLQAGFQALEKLENIITDNTLQNVQTFGIQGV